MYGLVRRLLHVAIVGAPAAIERPPPSTGGSSSKRVDAVLRLFVSLSWANETVFSVPVLSRPWHVACVCPQYLVITAEAPAPVPPVI